MFNGNIWPKSAPLRDIMLQTMSNLDFNLSGSLKVKCDNVVGLPIYTFPSKSNSKMWPNSALYDKIKGCKI